MEMKQELKEKATFNLPKKVLKKLDDEHMRIRGMLESRQISRTLIVETALEIVFDEFDTTKEKSSIFFRLKDKLEGGVNE